MRRKTIALDFDGVIHKYSQGWSDGTIYDGMVFGAIEGIAKLSKDYNIFIFTARDIHDVARYMEKRKYNIQIDDDPSLKFWNRDDAILITNRKLPAHAYIDDRGIRFTSWSNLLNEIRTMI